MTITREQVADLQTGDVVEVTHEDWPTGTVVRGPLWFDGGTLQVSRIIVRHWDKREPFDTGLTLTVVSRAPRPLYVNHPRTEPVRGDVARDDAIDNVCRAWVYGGIRGKAAWHWAQYPTEEAGPLTTVRLRLLVDGETGQVVP